MCLILHLLVYLTGLSPSQRCAFPLTAVSQAIQVRRKSAPDLFFACTLYRYKGLGGHQSHPLPVSCGCDVYVPYIRIPPESGLTNTHSIPAAQRKGMHPNTFSIECQLLLTTRQWYNFKKHSQVNNAQYICHQYDFHTS
ncbi:hypothetical protein K503DRAFT_56555 [Rhizopogon vinicolor AM-OR11-026]|uniref:Secreted protein n=1 Tax=Rhizopogon vinicolor AM-OR11-026 TaxID=1314800 RepID=A0A1B7MGJ4_9AGAM|nr:hypothetical protein K503DRAFT_56555 [Rhizopogon vinicolor AM-OR11-026]